MRTAVRLLAWVAFVVSLSGQTVTRNPATTKPKQPAGIRIGPHRMGETFNEWLAAEKIDLDGFCGIGANTCDDLRQISDTGNGDWHDRRGLPADAQEGTQWTFINGKLAYKQDVYSTEIAAKELAFLKEAYGPPALITKLPQQNAFGAKWNDFLVTWRLAVGTTLYMKALGGPKDDLIITFISREYAEAPVSREPNPYLSLEPALGGVK